MHYLVDTEKSLYEAGVDLRAAILRLGFAIMQVQELGPPGSGWEVECDEDCTVFTVDNPRYTQQLVNRDMRSTLALPWRISVYTEAGSTRIGFVRPLALFAALEVAAGVGPVAREIEDKLRQIVDEAR
jgi:uncharacterized protein (DUF302 family)